MQPTRCELNLGEIRHTSTNAFHNINSSRRDRDAEMERMTIDGLNSTTGHEIGPLSIRRGLRIY